MDPALLHIGLRVIDGVGAGSVLPATDDKALMVVLEAWEGVLAQFPESDMGLFTVAPSHGSADGRKLDVARIELPGQRAALGAEKT